MRTETQIMVDNHLDIIKNLVKIIQRLEYEGVDLSIDDILMVRKAKTLLGYVNPTSLEDGTGSKVR
jgi:hypothetical protein